MKHHQELPWATGIFRPGVENGGHGHICPQGNERVTKRPTLRALTNPSRMTWSMTWSLVLFGTFLGRTDGHVYYTGRGADFLVQPVSSGVFLQGWV